MAAADSRGVIIRPERAGPRQAAVQAGGGFVTSR